MPLASKFDITLFADDTYLTLTDNDLNTLQTRLNNELNSLNNWFLKHRGDRGVLLQFSVKLI